MLIGLHTDGHVGMFGVNLEVLFTKSSEGCRRKEGERVYYYFHNVVLATFI